MSRHVVQFSCGAASAVTAKLILAEVPAETVFLAVFYGLAAVRELLIAQLDGSLLPPQPPEQS